MSPIRFPQNGLSPEMAFRPFLTMLLKKNLKAVSDARRTP